MNREILSHISLILLDIYYGPERIRGDFHILSLISRESWNHLDGTSNRKGKWDSSYLSHILVSDKEGLVVVLLNYSISLDGVFVHRTPTTDFHVLAKVNGDIVAHIFHIIFSITFSFFETSSSMQLVNDLEKSFSFQEHWKYKENSFMLVIYLREGNQNSFQNDGLKRERLDLSPC